MEGHSTQILALGKEGKGNSATKFSLSVAYCCIFWAEKTFIVHREFDALGVCRQTPSPHAPLGALKSVEVKYPAADVKLMLNLSAGLNAVFVMSTVQLRGLFPCPVVCVVSAGRLPMCP
ncbi:hypothetical protein AVEN_51584-1 [Araneus ventricosus]|uniref:Uncharacterized protein n=1 Tax=Araneus ventricosus TaxID=182803 RepID=A0A4Y2ELJ7_ARAVE|nr:hypothetical protein AVEN_51584-1 [Araneus ventricosus]